MGLFVMEGDREKRVKDEVQNWLRKIVLVN